MRNNGRPTLIISVLAIVISGFTCWDTSLHQNLSVHAGRQVRLFVAYDPDDKKEETPLILLPVTYINDGGKSVVILDTKLHAKIMVQGRVVAEREFTTLREVDNILNSGLELRQKAILPIVVKGKSAETKLFGFVPVQQLMQVDIPQIFSLELSVYTLEQDDWEFHKKYVISEVSEVWQDLQEEGPIYQGRLYELIPSDS